MAKLASNLMLAAIEARYGYDVGYMRFMLSAAPKAFAKFEKHFALSSHREAADKRAYFAAKILGALAEDCGPCTQLVVDMAINSGMDVSEIEAVLRRDETRMASETKLGYAYADAIIKRSANADELRERVRARWGDKGLIDLALALQAGRLYPMLKDALGFAKACRQIKVRGRTIDIAESPA